MNVKSKIPLGKLLSKRLLLVAGVSLLVVGITSAYLTYRESYRQTSEGLHNSAKLAANTVFTYMDGIKHTIDTLAPYLDSDQSQIKRRQLFQNTLLKNQDTILEITLLHSDGSVDYSTRIGRDAKNNLEYTKLFYEIPDVSEPWIGNVFFSEDYSEPSLWVSVPIRKGEKEPPILLALISIRTVWNLFDLSAPQRLTYGESGIAYLIDSNAQLIAHPQSNQVLQNQTVDWLPDNIVDTHTLIHYYDNQGEPVFGIGAKVPEYNWIVIAEVSRNEVLRSAQSALLILFVSMVLVTIVSIYLSRRLSKDLTNDFEILRNWSEDLASGNTSARAIPNSQILEVNDLSSHFNEMSQNLETTIQKLKLADRLAALGKMAAVVAHEIRNPLSGIKPFVQKFESKVTEQDTKYIQGFVQVMPNEVQRLEKLVNDLLDYTKPYVIERRTVELSNFINSIMVQLSLRLQDDNIQLITNIETLQCDVSIDGDKMRQVFLNILTNAIHALKTVAEPKIWFMVSKTKDWLELTIKDNGPGIPGNIQNTIFEPFIKGKSGQGTGLGMSIAKRIVEEHQGTLELKSSTSNGTEFLIRLPI